MLSYLLSVLEYSTHQPEQQTYHYRQIFFTLYALPQTNDKHKQTETENGTEKGMKDVSTSN